MIAIILAAGYATRMYPLTENFPKSLLKIQGKEILSYLMDDISKIDDISHIYLVSNDKFINHFNEWLSVQKYKDKITIVNDGTNSNETRLGAVGDIKLVLNQFNIDDDILVMASDNLYYFSMTQFIDFFHDVNKTSIMVYEENEIEKLKKTGVAEIEGDNLKSFEEKPINPKDIYAVPPFYIYKRDIINSIKSINSKLDAPGFLVQLILQDNEIKVFKMPSKRIDIGNLETYYELR